MASEDMNAAAKVFFSSPRFAVAGASSDTSKFGYKSTSNSLTISTKKDIQIDRS